ncbi:SDR family oxidoreductase [Exiguobacterium acetylicum]|uniref:SDR family oxidoreductase n=1 Tax=Exiguobacterium acetylicum TaxID=41170 RepID=UPI001CA6FD01|nr:SDR family oxidoreductase [Exiguobacterium acetylicum]QZY85513.1 SDR family oxidoreductase [Exiguobacterium acetylicum]
MTKRPIAIVTGASQTRDIGAAICRQLASSGHDLVFTYFKATADWAASFTTELENQGARVLAIELDLGQANAADDLFDQVEDFGTPSILINNAAHSTMTDWRTLDAASLDQHYAVNLRAPLLLATRFTKRFVEAHLTSGRIIQLTSGQDLGPMPDEIAYATTKGALSTFTKTYAAAVAPLGITVNAVNPGPTDSTWMDEATRTALKPSFPFGRIGAPEDVARLIQFLVSPDGGWVTGQVIHSEGGFER